MFCCVCLCVLGVFLLSIALGNPVEFNWLTCLHASLRNSMNNQLSEGILYSINFPMILQFFFLLHTICIFFQAFQLWFFLLSIQLTLSHNATKYTINFNACGSLYFFTLWDFGMNVTIKWAIQIYIGSYIVGFFLPLLSCHACFALKFNHIQSRSHYFTFYGLFIWKTVRRDLSNKRKSFIRFVRCPFFLVYFYDEGKWSENHLDGN